MHVFLSSKNQSRWYDKMFFLSTLKLNLIVYHTIMHLINKIMKYFIYSQHARHFIQKYVKTTFHSCVWIGKALYDMIVLHNLTTFH